MRKVLLAPFMLLLTIAANAQTDSVRMELNHIFQYVNKSLIPTGYLNEYGPEVVEKKWINGTLADSNYVNPLVWSYVYATVYSGKI
ncbi:MAG: hypothetical protein JSS98_12920 [Bacteroidetes bacterium]|nr:hypothetical protein [Bacteroidota bacterium]